MSNLALSYAQIAIFGPFSLPVLYILCRHGLRGILGWLYLFIFCSLRVIGPALQISSAKNHTSSSAGSLIASIGLSPLLLATVGILHEARRTRNPNTKAATEWIFVILLHLLVTTGLALIATSSKAFEGKATSSDLTLLKVGISMLLLAWIFLCIWAVVSLKRIQSARKESEARDESLLLYAILAALPFIGIRVLYTFTLMLTDVKKLGNGGLGLRAGLGVVPEIIVVLIFVAVGFITSGVDREKNEQRELELERGSRTRESERGLKGAMHAV